MGTDKFTIPEVLFNPLLVEGYAPGGRPRPWQGCAVSASALACRAVWASAAHPAVCAHAWGRRGVHTWCNTQGSLALPHSAPAVAAVLKEAGTPPDGLQGMHHMAHDVISK